MCNVCAVLARVKVKLVDTLVRVEQSQCDNSGIALELLVERYTLEWWHDKRSRAVI